LLLSHAKLFPLFLPLLSVGAIEIFKLIHGTDNGGLFLIRGISRDALAIVAGFLSFLKQEEASDACVACRRNSGNSPVERRISLEKLVLAPRKLRSRSSPAKIRDEFASANLILLRARSCLAGKVKVLAGESETAQP